MNTEKYLVSVVTPFHNTRMAYFKRGYESLKRQTLGFNNIEWIVVIHNSDEIYVNEAKELTQESENVKIYVLNNNIRTPSSPRNYALDKVSGKYVCFLDSDDYLTDDGLKDAVDRMEEFGVEISSFRAQTQAEDDTVIAAIDTRARFSQLSQTLLIDKSDPEINKLIYAGGLTIWSKLIRHDFLEKYHIRFDEDMTYGEDVCFSMQCLCKSDKVLILPQTIVYVYFMNHGSLAQETNHTPESILKLARDFAKIFDVTLEGNFALEELGWPVLGYLADTIANTPNLPGTLKAEVSALMRKYFDVLGPLKPDAKFFNEQVAVFFMKRARVILLGEKEDDPVLTDSLLPILQKSAYTEYGMKYGFADIKSIDDYRNNVPVTDAAVYRPFVKLVTRIGESNIISGEKIVAFFSKVCPDGDTLLIPQTASFIGDYRDRLISQLNDAVYSTILLNMETVEDDKLIRFNNGAVYSNMRTSVLNQIKEKDIFNSHARSRKYKYGTITDPLELIVKKDHYDTRYAKLLFALADPDVSQIIAPFTVDVLDMMRLLKCVWEELTDDLENGTVSEKSGIPEDVRTKLQETLKASPERADEVRRIIGEGFDGVIKRLWPELRVIVACGSGENAVFTRQLLRYTGDIPLDYGYLDCAEAIIGKSTEPGSNKYILVKNHAFFEFLPEDSTDNKTFLWNELKDGDRYEVIITNLAGLYRYRSGMIIEASGIKDGQLMMRYCYNRRNKVELNGVFLDTLLTRQAGKICDEEEDMITYDFGVLPDRKENSFALFLKPEQDGSYDREKISDTMDRILMEKSRSYKKGRDEGRIGKIMVYILASAASELKKGEIPGVLNLKHASNDEEFLKELKERAAQ